MARRPFLASAVATACAAATDGALAGSGESADQLPIVDTHQHLWDLEKFRLPWIEKGSILERRHMHAEYAKEIAGLNVVQAVYMEVAVEPEQHLAETEAVEQWCRSREGVTVAGVISGRPERDDFSEYIRRFRDSKYVKGVRRLLQTTETPAGFAIKPEFIRGVRLLGEQGLSFDICIPAPRLGDAVKLIDACPGTQFILDHCGCANLQEPNQEQWKKHIDEIAARKNVVGKVSGIIATLKRGEWSSERMAPTVNHVLDTFGPERVVFGSDWPVCTLSATLAEWVRSLQEIVASRPLSEKRQLFAENARRVYRLLRG